MLRTYTAPEGFTFLGEPVKEFSILNNTTHGIFIIGGVPVGSIRYNRLTKSTIYVKPFVESLTVENGLKIVPLTSVITYSDYKFFINGEYIGLATCSKRRYATSNLNSLLSSSKRGLSRSNNPHLRTFLDEVFAYDYYEGKHYYDHPVCTKCASKEFKSIQY